jgi:hypothetical protein
MDLPKDISTNQIKIEIKSDKNLYFYISFWCWITTVLVKTTNWEYDALLDQDLEQELTEVRPDLLTEKPEVKKKAKNRDKITELEARLAELNSS